MKIKVTTERDCCHQAEDLVSYRGQSTIPDVLRPKFCKHCGQLWYLSRFTDAAGSSDSEYVRCIPSHHIGFQTPTIKHSFLPESEMSSSMEAK